MNVTMEFARQDDCLDKMVPSDLRVLVGQRDRLLTALASLVDDQSPEWHTMSQEQAVDFATDVYQKVKDSIGGSRT